jgi:hypothetical protein
LTSSGTTSVKGQISETIRTTSNKRHRRVLSVITGGAIIALSEATPTGSSSFFSQFAFWFRLLSADALIVGVLFMSTGSIYFFFIFHCVSRNTIRCSGHVDLITFFNFKAQVCLGMELLKQGILSFLIYAKLNCIFVIESSSTFTQETYSPAESKMKFSGRYNSAGAEKFSIMES